jgi:predicted XRE-type DNA-binding protein
MLIDIYKDILEFAEDLKQIEKNNLIKIKSRLKTRIEELQKQERLEMKQENPDSLLENI